MFEQSARQLMETFADYLHCVVGQRLKRAKSHRWFNWIKVKYISKCRAELFQQSSFFSYLIIGLII